jgi:hypothetical protein
MLSLRTRHGSPLLAALSVRLAVFVVLPLAGLLLVGGGLIVSALEGAFEHRLQREVQMVARALRVPVGEALREGRDQRLQRNLDSALSIGRVYGAHVYDERGRLVASVGEGGVDEHVAATEPERGGGGYERTGGRQVYAYFVPLVDGGTILLDEVGELDPALQAKLLRVLQDGAVRRVGADRERMLDVRIIVATNRDLEQEVLAGRFREDLFYRLTTFTLEVPPLRARDGDLEALTLWFLERHARESNKVVDDVSAEVERCLARYTFPGNVRELESVIEHAVTFATGRTVQLSDLPARVVRGAGERAGASPPPVPAALLGGSELLTLDELTLRYVDHVLELTGGNKRRAAALLGISRQTLYRHLGRGGR